MESNQSTAYSDGYMAYREGKRVANNPFNVMKPEQFDDFTAWRKGYFTAEKNSRKKTDEIMAGIDLSWSK